jgi:NAD(P)-dependent dehydrogenase (short-subunit alcohol dehydrogenase family)
MEAPHAEMLRGQRLDVALVTGAAGELGHRVAVALEELGASVALNHHSSTRPESLVPRCAVTSPPARRVASLFDPVCGSR